MRLYSANAFYVVRQCKNYAELNNNSLLIIRSKPLGIIAFYAALVMMGWTATPSGHAEEPPLPPGIDSERMGPGIKEPKLPTGLEDNKIPEEPALPEGLTIDQAVQPESAVDQSNKILPFDFNGFAEMRFGMRTQNDAHQRDVSIGELRLQTQVEKYFSAASFRLTTDFLYDPVLGRHAIDLERGTGSIDLREAYIIFTPADFMDVKAGRQILTWGTGDLIFINDLFPKDWNAFFIGRDEDYLKAPSDAFKVSLFHPFANIDIVYTPRFDPDRFIDGRRLSFFDPLRGDIVGRNAIVRPERPDQWFDDDEWAARLYRNIGAYELAVYGYDGFWKSPAGTDAVTGRVTFPKLSAYGASLRGPILQGIGNIEFGYYDSREDRDGDDPLVRNSELRFLVGYEQELISDLTMGAQYYLEYMLDHDAYLRTLPSGIEAADEGRHVLTIRLTWLTLNQNLQWSLFTFYSPSDNDAYLRPKIHYQIDDHWSAELGANFFLGEDKHTFFGQFEDNSNVYLGVRYGF